MPAGACGHLFSCPSFLTLSPRVASRRVGRIENVHFWDQRADFLKLAEGILKNDLVAEEFASAAERLIKPRGPRASERVAPGA